MMEDRFLYQLQEAPDPEFVNNLHKKLGQYPYEKSPRVSLAASPILNLAVLFGAAVLLLTIMAACVPEVRAYAEAVIQRMGIAFVDPQQVRDTAVQAVVEVTRVSPPPSLSVEEVRARLGFPVLLPGWVPEDLIYVHRSVHEYDPQGWEGSGKKLTIEYSRSADFDQAGGVLFLHASDGPIGAPPLLMESRQQAVLVNGQPGIYVHGGWQWDGQGDPQIRMGSLVWDDQSDDAYLTWSQEGVTYLLEAHNLGADLELLLRVAASMQR